MHGALARSIAVPHLVVLALASGACSTLSGSDHVAAETPLWNHRPNGHLEVVFRRNLTAPSRKTGEEYERGRPEVDEARFRVFVGSSDHGLYALRATDGSTLWRFETLAAVQSEPLYDRELDVVYFGSQDGALYAVRAQDGGLLYRYGTGAEVTRKPVLSGETLYFSNANDQVFAVHRRTGATKWKAGRTPAAGMEVAGHAGPLLFDNKIYFSFSDGFVSAFAANDGKEVWSPVDLTSLAEDARGTTELSKYLDVDTTPLVVEEDKKPLIVVASYSGGVFALDPEKGARIWGNTDITGVSDVVLFHEPKHFGPEELDSSSDRNIRPWIAEKNIVFAASGTTGLWALEPSSGRVLWRNKLPEGGMTAPVQIAGTIAVGTSRYGLFLIAPSTGGVIDGIDVGSGFAQAPRAAGSRLFILSNGGTMLGLNVDTPLARREATHWIW